MKEAEEAHREALSIRRELAQANPEAHLMPDVAMTLNNLANLYRATQRMKEGCSRTSCIIKYCAPPWLREPFASKGDLRTDCTRGCRLSVQREPRLRRRENWHGTKRP